MLLQKISKKLDFIHKKKINCFLKKFTLTQIYTRVFNMMYMNRVLKNVFKFITNIKLVFFEEGFNSIKNYNQKNLDIVKSLSMISNIELRKYKKKAFIEYRGLAYKRTCKKNSLERIYHFVCLNLMTANKRRFFDGTRRKAHY